MQLKVNGEKRELPDGTRVADLDDVGRPGTAVAVNGSVVPRSDHADRALVAGDEVEVVEAVQGG